VGGAVDLKRQRLKTADDRKFSVLGDLSVYRGSAAPPADWDDM